MAFKLGNNDVTFKVGSGDCTIYLGTTLLYSGDTPTPPTGEKVRITNTDGTVALSIPYNENDRVLHKSDFTSISPMGTYGDLIIGEGVYGADNNVFNIQTYYSTLHFNRMFVPSTWNLALMFDPNPQTQDDVCYSFYNPFGMYFNSSRYNSIEVDEIYVEDGANLWSTFAYGSRINNADFSNLTNDTWIGALFFYSYSRYNSNWGLKSIVLPPNITRIGCAALEFCHNLSAITIPNSVTSIGDWSFYECSGLTSINIPSGVTYIGQHAFSSCSGLTTITIPSGVTSVTDSSFNGCSALSAITIPNTVTRIENNAFNGCSSLSAITIPSGVTYYGSAAFANCSGLTSMEIPSGYTSIESELFNGCSSLSAITIPSGVTRIGDSSFNSCYSLTSIDIPSGVTHCGYSAFANCSGLTSITVNASTPPTLRNYVFDNTNDCPIYVPASSVNNYQSASGWSDYADRIQAIPT